MTASSREPGYIERCPVVQRLRDGELRSIVVLAGAGISVNAGVPDFRSPGTGLYDNLQKYDLPEPEAVFTLEYFRKNPQPFTMLAKELWPVSSRRPTPSHFFVRLLEQKGLLRRHFTQNIDGLDRAAGIGADRTVMAHGSFNAGHCIDCKQGFQPEFLRKHIIRGKIARCECGGLVKPDIVFFGEDLPSRFLTCSKRDLGRCDLIFCVGTSLQVEPFASLLGRAPPWVPRILINRELPAAFKERPGDMLLIGDCDEQIWQLTEALGWSQDLSQLVSPPVFSWIPRAQRPLTEPSVLDRRHVYVLMCLAVAFVALAARNHLRDGFSNTQLVGIVAWLLLIAGIGTHAANSTKQ